VTNMNYFSDGRDWFFEKRFGLFIHWGLYAIPAWHEQHQMLLGESRDEYRKLMSQFNPVQFDPDEWLDIAEAAGMKYLTFTSKHLDGFCMWDTAATDFNVMNTPFGKDILAMIADACHRRNFPLCIYYCVTDTHHPNYPNQDRGHELPKPEQGDQPDVLKYFEYVREQAREICTNYGKIHGFWWDCNETECFDPTVNEMIRSLQPGIIINNRGLSEGDFSTPERDFDISTTNQLEAYTSPVEACQSIGVESWGYREDEDYFTDRFLMESIDRVLTKNGNYLLNVGPKADGSIPEVSQQILRNIGDWYKRVSESLIDVEPASSLTTNNQVMLTRRGNTLYVHLVSPLSSDRVLLPPLNKLPLRASLLNTGEEIKTSIDVVPSCHTVKGPPPPEEHILRICRLPANKLPGEVLVLKLEFDSVM